MLQSPKTRQIDHALHARLCITGGTTAMRRAMTGSKLRQTITHAIIAAVCVSTTTANNEGGVDCYAHLTLGGIYQATPRDMEGVRGFIIRTDDGHHSWFPARHFLPVRADRHHLWPKNPHAVAA